MLRLENWSNIKLAGSTAPKGDREDLENAKRELAPFRSEHRDDLLYLCPCEKCVEKLILDIAVKFNARNLLIQGAPRLKTMQDSIQRVSDAARTLAYTLIELDDYCRDYLVELDDVDQVHLGRLYQKAAASKLPTPETNDSPASNGLFAETLLSLADYVSMRSGDLRGWRPSESVVDRGGNTNVIKRTFGPGGAYLVSWCWAAFENCRPETATASENGPFVRFVNAVYSYATGEIEENSTLLNWIKKLAKPLRQHDRCLQRFGGLESELEDLRAKAPTAASKLRIAELESEMEIAKEAMFEATQAVSQTILGKVPQRV